LRDIAFESLYIGTYKLKDEEPLSVEEKADHFEFQLEDQRSAKL
jgi:hypothetical protein